MNRFFLAALLAAFLLVPAVSKAVTVGPGKLEYSVDPGNSVSGEMFLQNESNVTQTFYPSFEKFTENNGGQKEFTKEQSDLATWFKMTPSLTLKAGESKQIPFRIIVPNDAPPGGHFAVIWWSTSPPDKSGKQVSIVTRAGVLVYLRVSGDVVESGSIESFSTPSWWLTGLPITFNFTFKNTGNSYLKPQGEIAVSNLFGFSKTTMKVNEFGAIVLPQAGKDFSETLSSDSLFFGVYHAKLSLVYGAASQVATRSYWFVVLPWGMTAFVLLVLLIVFIVIPRSIKKYNAWIIKQSRR